MRGQGGPQFTPSGVFQLTPTRAELGLYLRMARSEKLSRRLGQRTLPAGDPAWQQRDYGLQLDDLTDGRLVSEVAHVFQTGQAGARLLDRKSTRLNSSHLGISYAVFC